ncbi:MAG: XdhC family protein [Pirellulales bacterium]|nr:XdhC family protein [Pirellulales bacterium]
MRDLIRQLLTTVEAGDEVAYCRLVETRGSTPQKAGAAMLVFPDGSQAGTLGGGCVEAEVKRRALKILDEGPAEVLSFQLDDDYGWDDGLICGGRMRILVEPIRVAADLGDYFATLDQLLQRTEGLTECIVFDREKSGLPVPAAYLFNASGRLAAHRHAAQADHTALVRLREQLGEVADRPQPSAVQGIAYLPTLSRCRLLIVGGGHIGHAVGQLAVDLDFDVWVLDDREEYITAERFPRAVRRIAGPIGRVLRDIDITSDTYALIVTRGHNHDEEALFHLAERGARYVGMIGSKRKIKLIFDDLLAAGVSPEALAKVFAPVGIDIGSQTVPEIAVSILAELIAYRNRQGEVPGRPAPIAVGETL